MMKIELQSGAHEAPFEDGVPTMCAMEYAAYLAGERHSDTPKCVCPFLVRVMVRLNDMLDDNQRQVLKPYIVRCLGTKGDRQHGKRGDATVDWAQAHCSAITDKGSCVTGCTECSLAFVLHNLQMRPYLIPSYLEAVLDPEGMHDIEEDLDTLIAEEKRQLAKALLAGDG